MDVGHEHFQAVGDELDGTAELDGGRGRGQFVAVGMDLEAERAADVGCDDLHVVLGHAERVGKHMLEHVRALAAGGDGELAGRRVVGGQQRARLQADGGVAAESNVSSMTRSALAKAASTAPVSMALRKARLSPSSACSTGALGSSAVSLSVTAGNSSHSTRCARPRPRPRRGCGRRPLRPARRPSRRGPRPGVLRRRLHAGEAGQRADPGAGDKLASSAPVMTSATWLALGLARVDGDDPGVSERAAQKCGMQHARQRDIIGVAAAPGDGALCAGSRERAADVLFGRSSGVKRALASMMFGIPCGMLHADERNCGRFAAIVSAARSKYLRLHR